MRLGFSDIILLTGSFYRHLRVRFCEPQTHRIFLPTWLDKQFKYWRAQQMAQQKPLYYFCRFNNFLGREQNSCSFRYTPLLWAVEKNKIIENRVLEQIWGHTLIIPAKQETPEFKVRQFSVSWSYLNPTQRNKQKSKQARVGAHMKQTNKPQIPLLKTDKVSWSRL